MKLNLIALAVTILAVSAHADTKTPTPTGVSSTSGNSGASAVNITDPFASDQSDSPWKMAMSPVTSINGLKLNGRASSMTTNGQGTFDKFTPFTQNKSNLVSGFGSTTVGVGCDGINLGGVIDGQLSQYGTMIEEFIAQAPAMAVMFLAYSQPTVKAVIDEMNVVGQFGLDLSNMTCSGVRAIADKSAEEKRQAMAEAECTSDAGYKDPDCMSGSGITGSLVRIMQETKTTINDRSGALMGKVSSSTGGLVSFKASTSGAGAGNAGSLGQYITGSSAKNCPSDAPEGVLGYILSTSEISCDDMKNFAGLLPNYSTKDDVAGVEPRKFTLLDVSKKMTAQYYSWILDVTAANHATFNDTEGFKAIMNRTGTIISDSEHKELQRLAKNSPAEFVAQVRSLATLIALKDLQDVVTRLEVAVTTGLANQHEGEIISERHITGYKLAIDTLRAELKNLSDQITTDILKSSIGPTARR